MLEDLPHGEKNLSPLRELVQDTYRLGAKQRTKYFSQIFTSWGVDGFFLNCCGALAKRGFGLVCRVFS
jgi:hypothetical protein